MIPHGVEVFLGVDSIDLRWGFERLAGVVAERVGRSARSGALFVFRGRRGHAIKVLFFVPDARTPSTGGRLSLSGWRGPCIGYTPRSGRGAPIRVVGRTYSVPSRLIGHEVEARVHPDHVEVYYGKRLVERMDRLRGEHDVHIDYRHVIWSLVRKPGAFARYKYREELFPSAVFRLAYDALQGWRGDRADVEYVRILHLAASVMEAPVERALVALLELYQPFDYVAVKAISQPRESVVPTVYIGEPDLTAYDQLLEGRCA